MEKTPLGIFVVSAAARIARATISEVPGCAGCALTITGFPAANADAVSPPATEYASGKLLAPKTTTGPSGRHIDRKSGFAGFRAASALSNRARTHDPSSIRSANNLI